MAYIVPNELPQTCNECAFCCCKFSYPFWATDRGDKCNKQGFYCILDTQNPRRVMVVDFGDKTKKMEWCPLKEVVLCKDCTHWGGVVYGGRCKNWSAPAFGITQCTGADDFCSYGERRTE